ncbi:DUF6049 family protein [Nocardia sp. CNY236]|uniref:DUF6049 family protein n=1 Tax=Nocardia sp. CNY236 TaxID=1169152 RepID=UPI00040BA228|nr:DUF6049 family protein [Nocardia sp. CNY236]
MTHGLFRIFVAVLTIFGPAAALPLLDARTAAAQPTGFDAPSNPKFLKLSLDSVSPNTVTTTSDSLITVSGTVTNIGDRVVDDISVRIQRAPAITAPSGLRTTLRLDQAYYTVNGQFEDVAQRLRPGERQQFTLSIPLRSSSGEVSLLLSQPGVYPLLLNVNGEPAYGNQARLDDARFLLPVLGLPPIPARQGSGTGASAIPALTDTPVAMTVLWPLADRPRQLAGRPGSVDGVMELTDDELATSLGKGGRLDQLLATVEATTGTVGGRTQSMSSGICLAIDPDLLLTVDAMTRGYRVLASPSDPDGATRAGSGAEQAQTWLDRLRVLSRSMCTVALPFAQVDLTALAAVDDAALAARAIDEPADIVDAILSTRSLRGVGLPESGSIDERAGLLLRNHGFGTAVLASTATLPLGVQDLSESVASATTPVGPDMVDLPEIAAVESPITEPTPSDSAATSPGASSDVSPPGILAEPALRAVRFDIWSATALAAVGSNPPTPPFTPTQVRYDVSNDSRSARLQDALGAISWSALNPQANQPRSLLLVPPQQWGANREEAIALLRQIDLLSSSGLAVARPLYDLVAQPPDPQPYQPRYLTQAEQHAVPDRFVSPVREQGRRIDQMARALIEVPDAELTPHAFLTPLRDDLIRALSLSDRRADDATHSDIFARRRLNQVTRTMDQLRESVSIVPPGGVYTLASEQSPVLLVARNELPVAIQVRFRIEAPAGTKITDPGEQQLPPNGSRSFRIPTEVSDSRNLVIPISLTTPEGIALGSPTQVSVRSNAYGQALAIITGCAGLLLLILAGRRLWHRFRGQPDPADENVAADSEPARHRGTYRPPVVEQESLQETR